MTDLEGDIVDVPNPSGRGTGYRYFGAAKRLPGVLELFEKPPEAKKPRSLYAIYRRVDASYYGHRDGNDDEDGVLDSFEGEGEGKGDVGDAADEEREFVAHVPLPDEKEIERMIVEKKKKKELLSKYTSDRRAPGAPGRGQGHAQRPPPRVLY
ncbi:Pre-mRNA-splicing factor ISY [Ananas comosus]|uniref:Pre-mRNA-splicing factor ISY n=2 Tax=Ananas comosus TaxID=4615 RepID=A0A199VMB9_ANACO|nr:Pre-mRNA-splicing factor ISY [Ananas comosus]